MLLLNKQTNQSNEWQKKRTQVVFGGFRVIHFVQFHVFVYLFPCCDVRYDFHVKMGFELTTLG
jgi:hypothetical protein